MADPVTGLLEELRSEGWSVAVHNDYRINGEAMTFWLFTHPCGRWIKGEGRTDAEALTAARAALAGVLSAVDCTFEPTDHALGVLVDGGAPSTVAAAAPGGAPVLCRCGFAGYERDCATRVLCPACGDKNRKMKWHCFHLWWHRWKFLRRLSEQSELYQCSCKRMYAVNHDARAVLPWEAVRAHYESGGYIQ